MEDYLPNGYWPTGYWPTNYWPAAGEVIPPDPQLPSEFGDWANDYARPVTKKGHRRNKFPFNRKKGT